MVLGTSDVMRIVAGEAKGRRLRAPSGRDTRPTADRVREELFSNLGEISGLAVLDLFAGSGALGIEALSRGAARAVFVDDDRRAVATVRSNLDATGFAASVVRSDALRYLDRAAREGVRFDLILLDPPYDAAPRIAAALADRLPEVISENSRIVTESDKRSPLRLDLPLALERVYGDTRIAVHRAP